MNDTNSQRGDQTAWQHFDPTTSRNPQGPDRREEGGGLFGYQGPERRSGGDRRRSS